jgi:hypothetical protein
VEVANKQEIEYQPYIAAYRKRQANYITSYGSREDVKDNYIAQYNTKESLKDSEMKNKEHVSVCSGDMYMPITLYLRVYILSS